MDEKEVTTLIAQIDQIIANNKLAGDSTEPYSQLSGLALKLLEGALINLARIAAKK